MAKEQFTGLFAHDGVLEWTTLERGREGSVVIGSGAIALAEETEAASGEGETTKPPTDRATAKYDSSAAHRIKSQRRGIKGSVSVGIPSEHLLLRVINLPAVNDDELKSMVALQADKFSPFPVETMIVSHETLAEKEDGSCLVLMGAVRNDVVEPLGAFWEEAGMLPTRVDAAALGWWRLLKDAGEIATDGRRVVLVMGDAAVEIIVFAAGAPIMFRSIAASSENRGQFTDEIVYEVGYTLMSVELERGGESDLAITVWQKEGESSLVADRLREECSCPVNIKSFPAEIRISEGLARRLAELGSRGLNLVPDSWRRKEKNRLFKKRMAAIAGILIGIWALGAGSVWGGLYYQKIRIASLKATEEEWRKPAMEVRAMRGRVFMTEKYRDKTRSALECLREISGAQPPGVELTSFAYRKGESLKLTGEADAAGQVLAFIDALNGSKLFSEIKPGAQSHNPGSGKQVFEIEAKLPGGEE